MKNLPSQQDRQLAIGRGKYVIHQIAKKFNAKNFPTVREAKRLPNGQLPETFPANHGRRMKKSDILMAEQLWINHLYKCCVVGIPGESKASRYSIREVGGQRSRHLTKKMGKLVAAGIIYGSKSEEKEYGDKYEDSTKDGYGFKPLTFPARKGFSFYWTPEFLHLVSRRFPKAYTFNPVQRDPELFPDLYPAQITQERGGATKRHTYICPKTIRNEVMSTKASAKAESESEEEKDLLSASANAERSELEDGNGREKAVAKITAAIQGEKSSTPAFDFSLEEMMDKKLGAAITRRLLTSGQLVLANAILLVQMYMRKIAPLTGRVHHPSSVKTAIYNAIDLLERYPEGGQEKAFDEFSQTIDRVQQRMERGGGFFVVTPDKWFDPDYQANIYMHYRHYLLPFRKRRAEMDEWKQMKEAAKAQAETGNDDWARHQDRYSGLAYSMKHYLSHHHKSDMRLQNANLFTWSAIIRAMVRNDGVDYQQVVDVAKWMLTSNGHSAKWWRSDSCFGVGIRSPRSFRKHFPKIQGAYLEAQHGSGKRRKTHIN